MIRRRTALLALGFAAMSSFVGCSDHPFRVEVAPGYESSRPAWLSDPALHDRTRRAAELAARRWGGAALENVTVLYVPGIFRCGYDGYFDGCTRRTGDEFVIELLWWGKACVEGTSLAHEVGHLGHEDHSDDRWCSEEFWDGMGEELRQSVPSSEPRTHDCLDSLGYRMRRQSEQDYCGERRDDDEEEHDDQGRAAARLSAACCGATSRSPPATSSRRGSPSR
jgi:hypothetical protein